MSELCYCCTARKLMHTRRVLAGAKEVSDTQVDIFQVQESTDFVFAQHHLLMSCPCSSAFRSSREDARCSEVRVPSHQG